MDGPGPNSDHQIQLAHLVKIIFVPPPRHVHWHGGFPDQGLPFSDPAQGVPPSFPLPHKYFHHRSLQYFENSYMRPLQGFSGSLLTAPLSIIISSTMISCFLPQLHGFKNLFTSTFILYTPLLPLIHFFPPDGLSKLRSLVFQFKDCKHDCVDNHCNRDEDRISGKECKEYEPKHWFSENIEARNHGCSRRDRKTPRRLPPA